MNLYKHLQWVLAIGFTAAMAYVRKELDSETVLNSFVALSLL